MLKRITDASKDLGCSNEHSRKMIKLGLWPAYRLGPKALRIDPDEIRALSKLIHERDRNSEVAE